MPSRKCDDDTKDDIRKARMRNYFRSFTWFAPISMRGITLENLLLP